MSEFSPTSPENERRGTATLVQVIRNALSKGNPKRVRNAAVWWSIKAVKEVGYPIVSAMLSTALVWAIIFRLPTQIEKALDAQQKVVAAAVATTGDTVAGALRANAESMKELAQTSRKVELGTEVAQALAANRYRCIQPKPCPPEKICPPPPPSCQEHPKSPSPQTSAKPGRGESTR